MAGGQPARLYTGVLSGVGHRASGRVSIYRVDAGTVILRFEDFDVQNGPDYRVYLVPRAGQRSPDGGIELGGLKANRGDLNVDVASGTDVSANPNVLIWCRAFAVPVAEAVLSPV